VREDVVNVATPAALTVPMPRTAGPSRNVTGPVAPAYTVAENVTGVFGEDGFKEDVRVTVAGALETIWIAVPTAGLLLLSPP
jgi:hypothetical protein